MSYTENDMTKTEARVSMRRCREALRAFEAAMKGDDVDAMIEAANEASGTAAQLGDYAEQRDEATR